MMIWSDSLTSEQVQRAAHADENIGLEKFDALTRPRVRRHAWNVLLYRIGSRRTFNTGTYGAGAHGAASYDDYGWFIARLFDLDPSARVAYYNGRDNFHHMTKHQYETGIRDNAEREPLKDVPVDDLVFGRLYPR